MNLIVFSPPKDLIVLIKTVSILRVRKSRVKGKKMRDYKSRPPDIFRIFSPEGEGRERVEAKAWASEIALSAPQSPAAARPHPAHILFRRRQHLRQFSARAAPRDFCRRGQRVIWGLGNCAAAAEEQGQGCDLTLWPFPPTVLRLRPQIPLHGCRFWFYP